MGEVLLVRDGDLNRSVALKVMREDATASRARFIEEAQILAQLEHPNIVPLHELGFAGDTPYVTLRYVRGKTLAGILDELRADPRAYSLTRLMQMYQQICQAISYAHAKGVVHRDLKPANVMVGEHGEVQVLDWGLALVLHESSDVAITTRAVAEVAGTVHGTPGYLAPEQAMGERVDGRADIYALGVILYELLTHRRLFEVKTVQALFLATFRQAPIAPRSRAPERNIPLELERICLKALSKVATDRHQTASELITDIQNWLEAAADRDKRHELAEQRADEGAVRLEEYRHATLEVADRRRAVAALSKSFSTWQPVIEKRELFAAEDRARAAEDALVAKATAVVASLSKALEHEPDNARARGLLADYYYERFVESEEDNEQRRATYLGGLVERYHDGRYAEQLKGDGCLRLSSEPVGAEVNLYELVERDLQLQPCNQRSLGTTPIVELALPMGSYLLVVTHPGFRDVRYPIHITRNRRWSGRIRLLTDAQIGPGLIHVPAGPFLMGAGAESHSVEVDDFLIGAHPVTMREYLQFLNNLADLKGLDAARERAPRRSIQDTITYLVATADGRLALPGKDIEGDEWQLDWPVLAVNSLDAEEYCAWRSAKDGRHFRLPTETEWEKAARGVDGRRFPWGSRFDPSLCNIQESLRDRMTVLTIGQVQEDVSVYGVCGMAGNVSDWTATEVVANEGDDGRRQRIVRGGAWSLKRGWSEASARFHYEPSYVNESLGFRLALDLARDLS